MLFVALLLGACTSPRRDVVSPTSLRAQRVCRERMVELPPGTEARQARLAYSICLRNVDREAAPAAPATPPAAETTAPPQPAEATASAEERYLHCRLHSEAITAAAAAYNRTRWALLNSPQDPASPERQQAEADLNRALDDLGQAIPPRMRAGQDLVPDAMRQFLGCDRSRFE